ncbi:peptidyl-prolyl cis-trans isomerase [Ameyamaea chiangmaiensis]|uniref:Parvulin-like PPIase n=1 Tax=Ameyamaea chiangmaiensis TaxID=442969 RepID=A0A850PB89_9PROT|nr:peptidyl-prolyl cis-trans isomerase [Ameyamaea chiangmaiensis]MBS4073708.1 peptidyl-prolyl cis-trans isomerase [Ameyamaea chiangmaiensis]NVN39800.1 peptidyl-prolyl cis-trans isomerase [Ameyamaea chiangmaiensis]
MISFLRHIFVDSWLGRIIALLIFVVFAALGMNGLFDSGAFGAGDVVASVAGEKIHADDLARGVQSGLTQTARQMGVADASALPPATRDQIAREALQRLLMEREIAVAARRHGLVVPDSAVRDEIFAMPYFKGTTGQFDHAVLNQKLAQIGMTEKQLVEMVRAEIASRGLMEAIGGSIAVPDIMVRRIFDFDAELRSLDVAQIRFASMTPPAAPDEAVLRRFYDNHPQDFRTPEYRHIRAVVLSADTIARSMNIADADLHRVYDLQSNRFHVPELRSLQLVTAPDQAAADRVAAQWKAGADWQAVQAAAKGSAAVEMPDTRASDLPSDALSKLVFAAPTDAVQGPVKVDTGWVVFRVNAVKAPHDTSFEHARADIHDEIAHAQAPGLVGQRLPRFQDAVAGGGDLDKIPTDIGAVAVSGALDAQGLTREGEPAPLPGDKAVHDAIINRAFVQGKGAHPSVVSAGHDTWFALVVDDVTPAAKRPFDEVRDKVLAAWTQAQVRQQANERATSLYVAATDKGGIASVPDAGAGLLHGVSVTRNGGPDVPAALTHVAFGLKVGQSTMIEADDSFYIATVTGITHPPVSSNQTGYDRVRGSLDQSIGDDLGMSYVADLEKTLKPKTNMAVFNQVVARFSAQPGAGG